MSIAPFTDEVPPGTQTADLVVGIGASAGGLKALQQFVQAVPPDSGMAFVVILHLDPDRASRMHELLQDRCAIPVTKVSASMEVVANHLYVIPSDQDLEMRGGRLELRNRGERWEHAPVDLFFRTLAESCGAGAAGVVLSGTGSDGTAGIRYIREAGGITIAQSPEEAEYDGMPTSAIATGLIDVVLPSARMPAELMRLRPARNGEGTPEDDEGALLRILRTLQGRTGHDFSQYKRATLMRRVSRRLRFNQVSALDEYRPLLEANTQEQQALLRDLLISVSSFFRDPDAFEALAAQVPSLFAGKTAGDTVRVWVVGCATGEEVYSVAMVLAEYASTLAEAPRLQLFATDIDEHGYAWARAGLYPAASVANVSAERLRRFFTPEGADYRIAKSLRELVLFAGHNVLQDPPFSRMDLISCRNLFIYLQPQAQERVLETFLFSLNADGLLLLGASESVGEHGLFVPADPTQRLYRRNAAPYRLAPRVTRMDLEPNMVLPARRSQTGAAYPPAPAFSYSGSHARLLEQHVAASAVVNERLDVVHLSAAACRFLHLGEGSPTHNVLRLADEELSRVLRTALHQAFSRGTATMRRVTTQVDGTREVLTVHVRAFPDDGTEVRHALIVFEPMGAAPEAEESAGRVASTELELETELRRTRELLESASIAHDQTVAALQVVNEELQSINEEQRAATEELETGREEIQSINEELTTINQEHQATIEELQRTNADLQNLIESTEVGTIFVDRRMCIRRFTPAAATLFNVIITDRGRPLAHITHRLKYDRLLEDVATVLESLQRLEREVVSDRGDAFVMRINPYRSLDGGPDGAVITFFDNTEQHQAAEDLRTAKQQAESANLAKSTFLSTLSHEFRTPLNAILGYADLLSVDGPLNDAQQHKVRHIQTGGWHLAAMIEEILSFAKLDGGHSDVERTELDARSIARDACSILESSALARGLTLQAELPEEPVRIVTDVDKVRQVLINLCGNAVKYTMSGVIRVRVQLVDERVLFDVIDTGIGIAPEHLERVFERFWQVDGRSTRAAGGLGIGLAAAREYARLLGGEVTVKSELGKGSTFRLSLPVE